MLEIIDKPFAMPKRTTKSLKPSLTFRGDDGVDMVSCFYDRDMDPPFSCKSEAFHLLSTVESVSLP